MANIIGVYKITNPLGCSYVGSSKNIERRWRAHKSLLKKSHRKLIESFEKHGVENHNFEVIVECKENELRRLETFHGLNLNVLDTEKGLNLILPKLKDGSGGCSDDRIIWNRGKKGVQVAWNKGIKATPKERERLKNMCVGRKVWNKGMKYTEPSKRKGIKTNKPSHNSRLVLCTNTGIFYNSSTEASIYNRYSRQSINMMLDGKRENKTSLRYV